MTSAGCCCYYHCQTYSVLCLFAIHAGDPHASERIGPSCSRSQSGVSIGELVAALNGAELEQINAVQEQVRYSYYNSRGQPHLKGATTAKGHTGER